MAPKVKSVLSAVSDAVETACGWAILAVGLYCAVFMDVTGGGSLWTAVRGLTGHAAAPVDSPAAVRRVTVPAHGVETADPNQERVLVVFEEPKKDGLVAAVAAAPDAYLKRPEAAYTDSPADPGAGKDWKKSLKGDLRKFTTYGQGEQAPVSATVAAAPQQQAPAPVAIVAASGSAARVGAVAAARPGVGSRLSSGSGAQADTVRNIR